MFKSKTIEDWKKEAEDFLSNAKKALNRENRESTFWGMSMESFDIAREEGCKNSINEFEQSFKEKYSEDNEAGKLIEALKAFRSGPTHEKN